MGGVKGEGERSGTAAAWEEEAVRAGGGAQQHGQAGGDRSARVRGPVVGGA